MSNNFPHTQCRINSSKLQTFLLAQLNNCSKRYHPKSFLTWQNSYALGLAMSINLPTTFWNLINLIFRWCCHASISWIKLKTTTQPNLLQINCFYSGYKDFQALMLDAEIIFGLIYIVKVLYCIVLQFWSTQVRFVLNWESTTDYDSEMFTHKHYNIDLFIYLFIYTLQKSFYIFVRPLTCIVFWVGP